MPPQKSFNKAVILGAAGFIGINLAHALAKQGYDLVCFDRTSSPYWPMSAAVITGDFTALPDDLLSAMDDALVFHLVSSCRPLPGTSSAANEVVQDLVATIRYLEATKSRKLRWTFLSSGGTVYGQTNLEIIPESSPTDPLCSYGILKVTIEKYFALYNELHNLDYVITRPANPYGPWQHPLKGQGLISALLYKVLKKEPIEIWGDGSTVRDYIYIADAVQGIIAAATAGYSGEIYNIGSGCGLSINELIKIVGQTLNAYPLATYSEERRIDVRRNVLNTDKLSAHTGWQAETPIEAGVTQTAAWIRQHLHTF